MKKPVIIASIVGAAVLAIAAAVLVPNYSTSSIAEVDAYRHTISVASAGQIVSSERVAAAAGTPASVSSALDGRRTYSKLVKRVLEHGATCESTSGYASAGELGSTLHRSARTTCDKGSFHIDIVRVRESPASADGAIITVANDPEGITDHGRRRDLTYIRSSSVAAWAAYQIKADTGRDATVDCGTGELGTSSGSTADCVAAGSGSTYPVRVTFRQAGEPQSHYELEVGAGPAVFE